MPPTVPLSEDEVRRRRPLWVALSELWLDTDLTELDLRSVAWRAAASGLSDEEISRVHWNEVAPVVMWNLWSVAGVWSGFDEAWLCGQAARLAGRSPRLSLTRRLARRALDPEWRRLLALLPLAREAQAAATAPDDPDAYRVFVAHTIPPGG